MANIDGPRGFSVSGQFDNNSNSQPIPMPVPATNADPIARGDVVDQVQGGVASAQSPVNTTAFGIVEQVTDEKGSILKGPLPASLAGNVTLYPLTGLVFTAQTSGATVINETAIGQTIDFIANTPNAGTGRSTFELDSTTLGTGTIFKIIGKDNRQNNDWGDANVVLKVVSFANALFANTSA